MARAAQPTPPPPPPAVTPPGYAVASFRASFFKRVYDSTPPPATRGQLISAVEQIVGAFCDNHGIPESQVR
jgi:hypothetical protein